MSENRRLALRRDIQEIFRREPQWLGIFQVRYRLELVDLSWKSFMEAWLEMLGSGSLIVSFDQSADQFPRYLLVEVAGTRDRDCHTNPGVVFTPTPEGGRAWAPNAN